MLSITVGVPWAERNPTVMEGITSRLELELQGELDYATSAGPGDVAERRCVDGRGRIAEVRVVAQTKRLHPELQLQALFERDILGQREVDRFRARSVQQVAGGVSVGVVGGRNRVQVGDGKCRGVDTSA